MTVNFILVVTNNQNLLVKNRTKSNTSSIIWYIKKGRLLLFNLQFTYDKFTFSQIKQRNGLRESIIHTQDSNILKDECNQNMHTLIVILCLRRCERRRIAENTGIKHYSFDNASFFDLKPSALLIPEMQCETLAPNSAELCNQPFRVSFILRPLEKAADLIPINWIKSDRWQHSKIVSRSPSDS